MTYRLVHIDILEHPVLRGTGKRRREYSDTEAFIWLIHQARRKPGSLKVDGGEITLAEGELCHSFRFMKDVWSWSLGRVQSFLDRLVRNDMVNTRTDTGRLVISLCNFRKFQHPPRERNTRSNTVDKVDPIHSQYENQQVSRKKKEVGDSRGMDEGGVGETNPAPKYPNKAFPFAEEGQLDMDLAPMPAPPAPGLPPAPVVCDLDALGQDLTSDPITGEIDGEINDVITDVTDGEITDVIADVIHDPIADEIADQLTDQLTDQSSDLTLDPSPNETLDQIILAPEPPAPTPPDLAAPPVLITVTFHPQPITLPAPDVGTFPPDNVVRMAGHKAMKGRKPKGEHGRRWGPDEQVPPEWIEEGHRVRLQNGLPWADLEAEARRFARYWSSPDCPKPMKRDWKTTWVKWVDKPLYAESNRVQGGHHVQRYDASAQGQRSQKRNPAMAALAAAVKKPDDYPEDPGFWHGR